MASTIWSGDKIKALLPALGLGDNATIRSGTTDPMSVATAGNRGDMYIRTGATPGIYQKITTDATDTNWAIVPEALSALAASSVVVTDTLGNIKTDNGITYDSATDTLGVVKVNTPSIQRATSGILAIGNDGNSTTINIGTTGSTINLIGTTVYENVTNADVSNKYITINKNGGAGTATLAGIYIEESSSITGYDRTSGDRNSWLLKAPNTAGILTLTPGSIGFTVDRGIQTANRTGSNSSEAVNILSGDTVNGSTGNVNISSGSASGSGSSGNVVLSTGTSSGGTQGYVSLQANHINLQSSDILTSTVPYINGSNNLISSSVTPTELGYVSGVTSAIQTQLNGKQATGNYITALTGDATASGPGSAALTLATVNSNVGTFASVTVNAKGLVTAATALSGDATTSSAVLTLATVNGNVGSFGSSTSIPSFTVNAKGLITAASGNVVIAPAGTLTGTTLAANVVSSSLTSVGTITSGTWTGTTIAIANGGTGQTTANAAFNALSPMTTLGDIIYGGTSGAGTRLGGNTATTTQLLSSVGTGSAAQAPVWLTATSTNTAGAPVIRDGSGNFSAGTITAALSGNATTATTATNATNVATLATATNASFFPLFVASSSDSNQAVNLDSSGFTYNPSTNNLTATTFTGTLSGTATNATNVATVATATNASYFPLFVASSSDSNQAVNLDSSGFTYNPSTNNLTATTFTGALTGTASGNVTSVALSVPGSSIFSVTGSPVTTSGTLALATTGTSGSIPYFSSTSAISSPTTLLWDNTNAALQVGSSGGGTNVKVYATTSSTSTGNAAPMIQIYNSDGTNTGDAALEISIATQNWYVGVDNSASDRLAIGPGSTWDSSPSITISTGSAVEITSVLNVSTTSPVDNTHTIKNTSTSNKTVLIQNTSTSSSSDAIYALQLTKGSTTTTSAQRFQLFQANAGAQNMGYIAGNGADNAQFVSSSDRRLKKDIEPITNGLELINQLNPVNFNWKNTGIASTGFIAQEVAEVIPRMAIQTDDGINEEIGLGADGSPDPWGVMDAVLFPYLVAAIKDLKAQNDELKRRLDKLES